VITSSAITDTGFTVSWVQDTNTTSYTYRLNGNTATPSSSTSTSAVFGNLSADTSYNIVVTANNNNPVSAASNTIYLRTLLPPPAAPVPTTSLLTDTSFTVSWPAVPNATSYTYSVNGAAAIDRPSRTVDLTGLTPNTLYTIVVRSINNNPPPGSATISVTTLLPPPAAPSITRTQLTDTGFTVSWSAIPNATSYTYSLNGGSQINTTTSTSTTLTGLTPDTSYNIVVAATNNNASAVSNRLFIRTLVPRPAAFTVQSSNITSTEFTLSWPLDTNVTSYTYRLNGTLTTPTSSSSTSATFGNRIPNTVYDIVVIASNSNPDSRESSIQLRTTIAAPTNLVASSINASGFTLNWSASTGANNYKFLIGGSAFAPTYTAGATTASFRNLSQTTLYNVQVIATDGTRDSLPSTALPVTTIAPPPPLEFSSSGTNLPSSYVIPEGYTNIYIEILSGSGGGGGCGPGTNPSSGGGGGAYIFGTTTITPGNQLAISISGGDHVINGGAGGLASPTGPPLNPPTLGGHGDTATITIGATIIRVKGGRGGGVGGGFGNGYNNQPSHPDARQAGDTEPLTPPLWVNKTPGENGPISTYEGQGLRGRSGKDGYSGGAAGMANAPAGDIRGNGTSGSGGYYLIRLTSV
jgi:hypothetical protein